MVRTQIYLTEKERSALQEMADETGKTQSELIRSAVDDFIEQQYVRDRSAFLQQARGIWKDREDLPDFRALRREFDRMAQLEG